MATLRKLIGPTHPVGQFLRKVYRGISRFSLPAPKVIFYPCLLLFIAGRSCYHFVKRVFLVEPLLKAYCTSYGRGLTAGVYIPWITGMGKIVIGDNVNFSGWVGVAFASRYVDNPTLKIGNHTGIGHNSRFVVGSSITIGNNCRIAGDAFLFDSSGHPTDPTARLADEPAPLNEVRPIVLEDNVWIGARVTVFPGVTIGANSVVASGSVVLSDVPPNTVVAGNPARKVAALSAPQ